MKAVSIPPVILEKISRGEAVLFLGAGASYGCRSSKDNSTCPTGPELGRLLSEKFLGGKRASEPLARIADFAISEAGLADVQRYVADIFDPIKPSDFHLLIPKFRWRAIVTTNYDRVIEQAYEKAVDRLQDPVPVLRDGDMGRANLDVRGVPILKLHGCISQAGDTSVPLILANEQYVKHSRGRERLSTNFKELARDHPIIFCGYQFNDLHVQAILFGLDDPQIDRPMYMAVNPAFEEMDVRLWGRHRLTAVSATFEDFLLSIDRSISPKTRALGQLLDRAQGSLSRWFKVGRTPTGSLQSLLAGRIQHIHPDLPIENAKPERFYRGDSRSWSPIQTDLDFPRSLGSQLLSTILTAPKSAGTRFVLVKGHAGCGKSVLLRRTAWDSATAPHDALTFYVQDSAAGLADHLSELCEITGERINVFVDNVLADFDEIAKAVRFAKSRKLPVTFVASARYNEWSAAADNFGLIPDEEFTIGNLSQREAEALCDLLEKHQCLGDLASYPPAQRPVRFMEVHERQLLVALHEVTSGKPLREIVLSEYRNILPPAAQELYLDICTMHRLGVLVRAGLISRISGIRFETFKDKFLSPLDRVVSVLHDWQSRDFVYKARHRDIAQIVFEEVLRDQEDRANQIARIVGALNTDYTSDNRAASTLLKGRLLADEFADRTLVDRVFSSAEHAGIDKTFLLQQKALFELKHPGGNARSAMDLIEEAIDSADRPSSSLFHTKATIYKVLSREQSIGNALQNRYLEDALVLLKKHGGLKQNYSAGSICEVLLIQAKRMIEELDLGERQKLDDEAVLRKVTELERALSEAIQRFPDDLFLTNIKAELHTALLDQPKAVALLARAHDKNPANELVALRLSRQYQSASNRVEAMAVLRRALTLNPRSKSLSFDLAMILIESNEQDHLPEISGLLRRSFSDGDSHFEAQFWYARHEFLYGEQARSKRIYDLFASRSNPYVNPTTKKAPVKNSDGTIKIFDGSIINLRGDFAFVRSPSINGDVYLHRNDLRDADWTSLRAGDPIAFKLGFSFRGPACLDASLKR